MKKSIRTVRKSYRKIGKYRYYPYAISSVAAAIVLIFGAFLFFLFLTMHMWSNLHERQTKVANKISLEEDISSTSLSQTADSPDNLPENEDDSSITDEETPLITDEGNSTTTVTEDTTLRNDSFENGTYYVTASALNVRSGAGYGYDVVDLYPENKEVQIVSVVGEWGEIEIDEQTVWVNVNWLTDEKSYAQSHGKKGYQTEHFYRVTASGLNIRENAGMGYEVVGCCEQEEYVYVTDIVDGWGKVDTSGGNGWVNMAFCEQV